MAQPPASKGEALRIGAAILALIGAGCLPAPGADNAAYILLPYAAAAAATGVAFFSERWRQVALVAGVTASIACAVGEIAHLVLKGASGGFGYTLPGDQAVPSGGLPAAIAFVALVLTAAGILAALARSRAKE